MVAQATLVSAGGTMVLFFSWIDGIVSFVRDVTYQLVSGFRQYLRDRRAQKRKRTRETQWEEREQQLR